MKNCLLCGKEMTSTLATIEGKRISFQNRKYCLECSPYGLHNTKKLHGKKTIRKCDGCGAETYKKYCSARCRNVNRYKNNKEELNKKSYAASKKRKRDRKLEYILKLGGECIECGYKKSAAALSFHHENPNEKSFQISKNSYSKEKNDKEIVKCVLLCIRCHMEEEDNNEKIYPRKERLKNIKIA
jgi:hypothetical protein